MSVFKEEPTTHLHVRNTITVGLVLVLVILLSAAFYYFRGGPEPPKPDTAAPTAPPAAPAAAPRPEATTTEEPPPTAREAAAASRRKAPTTKAPAAEPAAETARADAATLTIASDVPGASVFVDREFVGQAPVTLRNVAPGSKRINLSAEGYDGIAREVDISAGEATVTMRFKEVRLDAAVAVTHKHGMGQCEGSLRATADGLSYQTANTGDAFTLKYDQLEAFEVNYLEKNLRVKQKGGKTWNFTDKQAANADNLFVFHRDVGAAREKLAKGYTAAK